MKGKLSGNSRDEKKVFSFFQLSFFTQEGGGGAIPFILVVTRGFGEDI